MRSVILALILTTPAWATFTRASAVGQSCTSTSQTCSKIQVINAGDLVIVVLGAATTGITISSVSDTVNNLVHVASSNVSGNGASQDWFWLNSAASNTGHTTLTITASAVPNAVWQFQILRYTTTGSTPQIDTGAVGTASRTTLSNWTGPTISPTGGNDVILQSAYDPSVNVTAVATPYTMAVGGTSHLPVAENINTTNNASASFTNGSSSGVVTSVGFFDASGGSSQTRHTSRVF